MTALGKLQQREVERLNNAAQAAGYEVANPSHGHYQIKGALLVNYYPFSAGKTAYVGGTVKGRKQVAPEEAVAMARNLPPLKKGARRKSYRAIKLQMLKKNPTCNWCKAVLTVKTGTVDHVVPLSRGGLDNANNRVLACGPCNSARGNSMPEIK